MHSRACAVARPYAAHITQHAADDTIACRPGVTGYAGGKISACCLVLLYEMVEHERSDADCECKLYLSDLVLYHLIHYAIQSEEGRI